MIFEHDYEPVPGLPADLPAGETILWQGAPQWHLFARQALKIRWMMAYFGLLIVWGVADRLASGAPVRSVAIAVLEWGGLAAVALGLMALFAIGVARTTLYTVTNRRVVMRIGIALTMTLQIPFSRIGSAGVKSAADGSGEIALVLLAGEKIAYAVLWPHARPWTMGNAQPSLRGLTDVAEAAQILSRALAAAAEQPAQAMPVAQAKAGSGATAPAAA